MREAPPAPPGPGRLSHLPTAQVCLAPSGTRPRGFSCPWPASSPARGLMGAREAWEASRTGGGRHRGACVARGEPARRGAAVRGGSGLGVIRLKGDSSSLADSSHSSKRTSTARAWRRSQKGAGGPPLTAAQGRLPVAWGVGAAARLVPALGSRPPPPPRPEQPAPGLVRAQARRPGPRPPCLPDRTLAGPAASPARPPSAS